MKRKLLAICLAGLIILQMGGVTIFAQNQEIDMVELGEKTDNVESNQDVNEMEEDIDSKTISIEVTEEINDVEIENDILKLPRQEITEELDDSSVDIETTDSKEGENTENEETFEEESTDELDDISTTKDVSLPESDEEGVSLSKAEKNAEQSKQEKNIVIKENNTINFEDDRYKTLSTVFVSDTFQSNAVSNTRSVSPTNVSEICTTAPAITDNAALYIADANYSKIRFSAIVTWEQYVSAIEFGMLTCEFDELEENNAELTLDNTSISFTRNVAYNRDEEIYNIFDASDDEHLIFVGTTSDILPEKYIKYYVARPYIIYETDETTICVYGETYATSVYEKAKALLESEEYSDDEIINGYVKAAELSMAEEVDLDAEICRNIATDFGIDVIKFMPEESHFYTITFTSEEDATFEILDQFGDVLPDIEIDRITNKSAYLFEEGQTYYIRVTGEPDTEYSIRALLCLENAIIFDFANDTEGLTFGGGASGTVENGILNVSIDKSLSLTQAYVQKNNFPIDLLEYSRLIVRLKNATDETTLSGTISIDLEYDDSYLNYTLDSSMPSNMTNFENVEFDCTTRYGMIRSLKFGVGPVIASFSGNIYIDSIAIIPMPETVAWEFDETIEEWGCNDQVDSMSVEDGILTFDVLGRVSGMTPAITSPSVSAYDFENYNVLKMRLKNNSSAELMQIYFTTLAQDSFSESKKFLVDIQPNSNQHIEYTIMLTEHELFTDNLKGIMISIPGEGSVSIDYIRLFTYRDVVWDFDDNTLQGFYSSNGRHILSPENGAMLVEKTDLNSGGIYSPSQLNLPTSEYRYLTLGVNSASENSLFEVYFRTDDMNGFAANDYTNKIVYKHVLNIKQSDTYKEYVIDLAYAQENWTSGYTGNLQELMMAFVTSGDYEIDYFMLSKHRTSYEDVVWDFDDNTLQGFTSSNERHSISSDGGIMTVCSTELTNGGIKTPDSINLPASKYRYLVFGVDTASSDSKLEVYFKSTSMDSFAAYDWANRVLYKHIITIEESDTFREYVVDLIYAPEEWTSAYGGTVDEFMLAFLTPGTYEIDYIKLTNNADGTGDNESHLDGDDDSEEADGTVNIDAEKDFVYKIVISKNNNYAVSTYTLNYDENVFELIDACAFTYLPEIEAGQVVGTDITIVSATEGAITFSVSNNTAAGIINCFKLKALQSGESHVSVIANVEQ